MTLTTIKKPKKQKRWLFPEAIEREYVKYLQAIAKQISDTARKKLPEITPHLKKTLRQDDSIEILEQWLTELLQATTFYTRDNDIRPAVRQFLSQTAEFNKKQFHKVLKSAYKVDIFLTEPWLDEPLLQAEWQNINLIKSIPTQLQEKLRYRMVEALRKGESYKSLAADLEKLLDMPKRRATIIARDQIGKLNGRLTQLRQENIGVKSYIWRGSLDERERLLHVEREGKEFRWDNPPEDGHPGQPILCRCSAEAVLPEFGELISQNNVIVINGGEFDHSNHLEVNQETLPTDINKVINIGRNLHLRYKTLLDNAIAENSPHLGIMDIMKQEGVELGGIINVTGFEKNAVAEISEAVKRYPKKWIEKANEYGTVFVRETTSRSFCQKIPSEYDKNVHLRWLKKTYPLLRTKDLFRQVKANDVLITTNKSRDKAYRLSTHIHEYGHRLQQVLPELDNYFVEFWKKSTENDVIEKLDDLFPHVGFGKTEITKKDHFPSPYYGKMYGDEYDPKPREMLTMTFEAMLGGDKNKFQELVSKKPDLFHLGLALLTRYK
ncbi:phage minor head protein [Gallibacterium anatis]|uniref:phage head morphogenesis protein n=1 Tax=Gallibacterium anatis TaxID=750 RepID=UPI00211AD3FB|nr:phage minor head protein [Gallibacterium anatis]WAX71612.1 phage minor head protein [Gallibacterium anatis]